MYPTPILSLLLPAQSASSNSLSHSMTHLHIHFWGRPVLVSQTLSKTEHTSLFQLWSSLFPASVTLPFILSPKPKPKSFPWHISFVQLTRSVLSPLYALYSSCSLPFTFLCPICGLSSELRPNNLPYFCPINNFSPSSHSPTAIGVIILKQQQQKPVSHPLWVKSELLRVAASIMCVLSNSPSWSSWPVSSTTSMSYVLATLHFYESAKIHSRGLFGGWSTKNNLCDQEKINFTMTKDSILPNVNKNLWVLQIHIQIIWII